MTHALSHYPNQSKLPIRRSIKVDSWRRCLDFVHVIPDGPNEDWAYREFRPYSTSIVVAR